MFSDFISFCLDYSIPTYIFFSVLFWYNAVVDSEKSDMGKGGDLLEMLKLLGVSGPVLFVLLSGTKATVFTSVSSPVPHLVGFLDFHLSVVISEIIFIGWVTPDQ